jgi:hypothetical protein
MRLGRFAFRSTVASFTFLPTSSKVTPTSFILTPPSSEIAAARNTFTPPSSNVTPTSSKVTPASSKVAVASFNFTPPSYKNREACFTFYPCFIGAVQYTVLTKERVAVWLPLAFLMILKVYFLTTLTNFIELTWIYSGIVAPILPLM